MQAGPGDQTGGATLAWEFFTGTGPREREFGPSDRATKDMMTSPDVAAHRQNFIAQGGGTYGPTAVKFGWIHAKDGPLTAGSNMTRQVVGSFMITIQEGRNGDASFTLTNTTSLKSFLYDAPGVQNIQPNEMQVMSNKYQTFWWVERGLIKH